jgi:DNA-binding NarL/FixJ family response regulator
MQSRLTAREREVLALMAEGHSNDGIAEHLGVTARTVETHTNRIFFKLGLEADPATHRRVLAVLAHLGACVERGGSLRGMDGTTTRWANRDRRLDLVG